MFRAKHLVMALGLATVTNVLRATKKQIPASVKVRKCVRASVQGVTHAIPPPSLQTLMSAKWMEILAARMAVTV